MNEQIGKCLVIHGDCRSELVNFENQIDLIVTSPPYADARRNHYDSVHPDQFAEWFLTFHDSFYKALTPRGSLVLNIKDMDPNQERWCLTVDCHKDFMKLMCALPNGPVRKSPTVKDLTETSMALSIVKFNCNDMSNAKFIILARGMNARHAMSFKREIAYICQDYGFNLEGAFYPPWEPKDDSKAKQLVYESMKAVIGKEPRMYAIHAGLECALFLTKYPDMDSASLGPTIENAHSPDEKLDIATLEPFIQTVLKIVNSK